MNLKKLNLTILLMTILVLIPTIHVLASTNPSTFYISGGIYPSAATYTIWRESDTYYAKNAYGAIGYSGSNATQIWNNVKDYGLTSGRTWEEKVLMKGDIEITHSIGIPNNTILEINGRIKAADSCSIPDGRGMLQNSGFPTVTPNSNIEILGGEIDGNKANNPTAHFEGIFLMMVDNFRIENVIVHDSPEVGIALYPAQTNKLMNGEILNCISYNNDADGLQLEMAIDGSKGAQIKIIGGRYHHNTNNGINLKCTTTWTESPLLQVTIQNVEADHNGNQGITASMVGTGLKKISVFGNYVHENSANGIWLQDVTYGIVSDNTVEYNSFSGIELWSCRNITIISNIAINNSKGASGYPNQEAGISLIYSNSTVIGDNVCGLQKYGISIITNAISEWITVHDNSLLGNTTPIYTYGTINNLTIHDNQGAADYP